MCKGFIMIPRDFFESGYWCQSRTYNDCEALLDIVSQVRFDASEQFARIGGREVIWGQAEWPASVRFLAQRWSWTERHVRTFLSSLKKKGIISTDDSQGVNVIKLLKYNYFSGNVGQKIDTPCDTTSDTKNTLNINELIDKVTQQVTQCLTQQRHSSDTKHNNGNNIHNIIPPISPKGETDKSSKFKKPTIEDIEALITEKNYHFDATAFWNFYESKGWMVGKNHMKNWKAACATWERNRNRYGTTKNNYGTYQGTSENPSDDQMVRDAVSLIDSLATKRRNGSQ